MKKTLTLLSSLLISSGLLYADKPSWAGNGGKPNSYEKQAHKDVMTQKSKHKKEKKKSSTENSYSDEEQYTNNKKVSYEGEGRSDSEHIDKKIDETKKNWINKFFDFVN